jgi:hypothetical protein
VASNGRQLKLQCTSTCAELDYSVLRLLGDRDSDAFFDLPSHSSVLPGTSLGLVSMGVGPSLHHPPVPPSCSVHAVTASSCNLGGAFFYYDGATWSGDSGAALLFEEGQVVGMHQEVLELDDKPEASPPARAGTKRARSKARLSQVERQLEEVSVASSSHAKVCRALLLASA